MIREAPDAQLNTVRAWASSFNGSSPPYIPSSGLMKPPEVLVDACKSNTPLLTLAMPLGTTLAAIPLPEIVDWCSSFPHGLLRGFQRCSGFLVE